MITRIFIYAFLAFSVAAEAMQCSVHELSNPTFFADGFSDVVARYKNKSITSASENARFIEISKSQNVKDMLFLHWDFKMLKALNDKVFITRDSFGKLGVDAAVRLGQELLILRLQESPQFKDLVVAKYADYKSVRLAIFNKGQSPAQVEALRKIIENARNDFAQILSQHLRKQTEVSELVTQNGLSKMKDWHTFELAAGSSDMASTLARFSHFKAKLGVPEGRPVNRELVGATVQRIEGQLRKVFVSELQGTKLLEKGPSGEWIPSKILLEVVRKGPSDQSNFISYLQAVSEARFRQSISKRSCEAIKEYFELIDLFAPSVLVEKPVEIDLSGANKGALSIDFAGQNVFNLFYTADALTYAAKKQGSKADLADIAVGKSRQNDMEYASPRLQSLRDNINSIVKRMGLGEAKFTGDDGMVVLQKEMNENLFNTFMKDLKAFALTGAIADYRVVYIHPMFKKGRIVDGEAMRLKISSEGEAAEKKFRSWSSNLFSIESTGGLGIGVRLYPDANRMEFVFVGNHAERAKTRMEREMKGGFNKQFGYERGESFNIDP